MNENFIGSYLTPEKQALKMILKHRENCVDWESAKKSTLTTIDEILKVIHNWDVKTTSANFEYWYSVQRQIKKQKDEPK